MFIQIRAAYNLNFNFSYGNSEDIDFSQLSEAGKHFLEQIPDLTYMLKSKLSLPDAE